MIERTNHTHDTAGLVAEDLLQLLIAACLGGPVCVGGGDCGVRCSLAWKKSSASTPSGNSLGRNDQLSSMRSSSLDDLWRWVWCSKRCDDDVE
ncbi:MAG TPA: hypothetical protein VFT22_25675 [Kofleriaceae bacterium]|nr:hypothetical protein [Kofleriaceae bacterium]